MLTLYFRKPMHGGKLTDDMPDTWSVSSFTCAPLAPGQPPPPEGLVANIAKSLLGGDGQPVSPGVLRGHDLENGLRDALRAAWA